MLVGWLPAAGSGRRRRGPGRGRGAAGVGDRGGHLEIKDGDVRGVAGHYCPPFVVCGTQPLATKLEHIGSGRNYGPSLILNLLSSISLRSQINAWVYHVIESRAHLLDFKTIGSRQVAPAPDQLISNTEAVAAKPPVGPRRLSIQAPFPY